MYMGTNYSKLEWEFVFIRVAVERDVLRQKSSSRRPFDKGKKAVVYPDPASYSARTLQRNEKNTAAPAAKPDGERPSNPPPAPAFSKPITLESGSFESRESALVRLFFQDRLSRGGCRPGAVRGRRVGICDE